MENKPLFREEAVSHQVRKVEGNIVLKQPSSIKLLFLLIVTLSASIALFISIGSYSRKEVVRGVLELSHGVVKYKAPQSGILLGMDHQAGQYIEKDTNLSYIYTENFGEGGVGVNKSKVIKTQKRLEVEHYKLRKLKSQNALELAALNVELSSVDRSLSELTNQMRLLNKKKLLNEKILEQQESLLKTGYIAELEINKQRDVLLNIETNISNLLVASSNLIERKKLLKISLDKLPFDQEEKKLDIENRILELNSELELFRQARQVFIRSFNEGYITNILVNQGDRVEEGQTLFSILPKDSDLRAVIYVPSSAFGFIKVGQKLNIRYSSYPYQKYGTYSGIISEVGSHLVLQNETKVPNLINTPSYRVVVNLDSQRVSTYGAQVKLTPGMLLEADIILDERNVIEWVFEPIFSMYGKMNNES